MRVTLLLSALFVGSVPLAAHHPFAGTYVEGREITIEGDVLQLEYREPHSFVHVVAQRGRDKERWIVEWRGASHLRRHGVTLGTLKPGQRVIVTGSPGRISADYRLRLRAIVRPGDGWKWRDASS